MTVITDSYGTYASLHLFTCISVPLKGWTTLYQKYHVSPVGAFDFGSNTSGFFRKKTAKYLSLISLF